MDSYDEVLEVVAENPGISTEKFPGDEELLEKAVQDGDVVRFNGRHWIVRKGKFAFSEYDHPDP